MAELAAEILVPITLFLMIGAVIISWLYFRKEKATVTAGEDYQDLAEEAVRGQRVLLEEIEQMNETLEEIETLLKEV